jgi:hypothetical protein
MKINTPAGLFWRNAALGLCVGALFWGGPSQATAILDVITGADMAGMKVTVQFLGGGTESVFWNTTLQDGTIPYGEGFRGGAFGTGWSLVQQGFTQGGYVDDQPNYVGPVGVWTLTSVAGVIESLQIDALAGNIVFDRFVDRMETPGSSYGRDFCTAEIWAVEPQSGPPSYCGSSVTLSGAENSAIYSALYSSPDLFGTLTLTWTNGFTPGSTLQFMADTDKIPEPATLALLTIGLLGATGARQLGRRAGGGS